MPSITKGSDYMPNIEKSRAERHSQTPVIRSAIRGLKEIIPSSDPSEIGGALATNTTAALALELSLKLIYMSFNKNAPPRSHELSVLWAGLPGEWRSEIDRNYRASHADFETFPAFAMQRSTEQPDKPTRRAGVDLTTADKFFGELSNEFVRARYFYETVEVGSWSFVFCPRKAMLVMIDILEAFYDHLMTPK